MSREVQDFVEAVQFCADHHSGDALKQLLSLRQNTTLSQKLPVGSALKVRTCLLKQFPRRHLVNIHSTRSAYSRAYQGDLELFV